MRNLGFGPAISLLFLGHGWQIKSPAMIEGVRPANGRAKSPTDESKQRTTEDHAASDRSPVAGAVDPDQRGPNAEADCSPDQKVPRVRMARPR